MQGDGRIYQLKGKQPGTLRSPYLWIAYYCRGKEHRESTKSTDRGVAERLLRRRLKQVGADQVGARRFLGPAAERVTMDSLFDALETDKVTNARRIPGEMVRLRARWQGYQAMEITPTHVAEWQRELLESGLSPKSCNNLTQLLGQAFRLAREQERVAYTPTIKPLTVPDNARNGTFTAEEFERLEAALPEHLREFARWSYITGWRAGAIRSLRWEDIKDGVLTVRPQYSKNRRAQDIPLESPLAEIIARCEKNRKGPYVFHYNDGNPIGSYKTAWRTALTKAGLKKKMFHDFRRTAATAMRRAGTPEEVAQKITGHVTNSMFRRYRIVDNGDVKGALKQREAYELRQLEEARAKAKAAEEAAAQRLAAERTQWATAPAISPRVQ